MGYRIHISNVSGAPDTAAVPDGFSVCAGVCEGAAAPPSVFENQAGGTSWGPFWEPFWELWAQFWHPRCSHLAPPDPSNPQQVCVLLMCCTHFSKSTVLSKSRPKDANMSLKWPLHHPKGTQGTPNWPLLGPNGAPAPQCRQNFERCSDFLGIHPRSCVQVPPKPLARDQHCFQNNSKGDST